MKALTTIASAANIVPTASYSGGTYTLTVVSGTSYIWIPGANDTSVVVNGSITLTAQGVFTATGTSVVLHGGTSAAITAVVSPIANAFFFATTFTPSQPARQVTVGEFPANPNFSRQHQISNEAYFIKRGTYGVAITLSNMADLALTQEVNLTWTPPVILTQPVGSTVVHPAPATMTVVPASEYVLTYSWYDSADGITFGSALSNGSVTFGSGTANAAGATTASLIITPANAGTRYYKCTVTDNAGSYGLTNGSVTTAIVSVVAT